MVKKPEIKKTKIIKLKGKRTKIESKTIKIQVFSFPSIAPTTL
jgi:hypothetical protein